MASKYPDATEAKFIQIATGQVGEQHYLYALDDDGRVHLLAPGSEVWQPVTDERRPPKA